MRCRSCDHEVNAEPNYCPHCGEPWEEKTLDDVDWPLELQIGPRLNLYRYIEEETGVEVDYGFTNDYELLVDIRIYRDGSVELVAADD